MKIFRLRLRNRQWCYSVYRSDDGEYLLDALVPRAFSYGVAALLKDAEIETFETDLDAFTKIVNDFVWRHHEPQWRERRVDDRIVHREPFDSNVVELRT